MIDVTYPYIVNNQTGAQTILDKLIDVDLGNDNISQTVDESFIDFIKKNEDMNILNVLSLQNLWKSGDSPYIRHTEQDTIFNKEGNPVSILGGTYKKVHKRYGAFGTPKESTADTIDVHGKSNLVHNLIQELSHGYQKGNPARGAIEAKYLGGKRYDIPGTREYRAHKIIHPFLKYIYENQGGVVPYIKQDKPVFQFAKEYMENIE